MLKKVRQVFFKEQLKQLQPKFVVWRFALKKEGKVVLVHHVAKQDECLKFVTVLQKSAN